MPDKSDIARHLAEICHRLYEKGFVAATDGNVSTRLPEGTILTTPSGLNKGRVHETDLVEVRMDGTAIGGNKRPSTELGMHLFIYRERSDVQAVVHAHPPYATGFAAARIPLTQPIFPEVITELGAIPLAPYATPSTSDVAASLAPFVAHANAVLLANHGVVTYGKDLDEAYFRMEKVEYAAHVTFVARMLGGEKPLTVRQIGALGAAAHSNYGRELPQLDWPAASRGTSPSARSRRSTKGTTKKRLRRSR